MASWETAEGTFSTGIMRDITERKQHQEYLAYLATHDPMTGLPNRRGLEDDMNRVVARAHRGIISTVLFMDLDKFKVVNDAYGHDAGDKALTSVAQLLSKQLRTEDLLVRMGGDEFAVLLEGIDPENAYIVAERMRGAVAEFADPLGDFKLTLSIGLAAFDGDCDRIEVLAHADEAMYMAKGQGGNQVVAYDPGRKDLRLAFRSQHSGGVGD